MRFLSTGKSTGTIKTNQPYFFSLDKAKRQNTILEIYDKNFAPDYPVEMLQEMLVAARFGVS